MTGMYWLSNTLKKILVGVGDYNGGSQTQLFVVPIIDFR